MRILLTLALLVPTAAFAADKPAVTFTKDEVSAAYALGQADGAAQTVEQNLAAVRQNLLATAAAKSLEDKMRGIADPPLSAKSLEKPKDHPAPPKALDPNKPGVLNSGDKK